MSEIGKYRKAIEQAAWACNVPVVSISPYDLADLDDQPILHVGVLNKDSADSIKHRFKEELARMLCTQPFGVTVFPSVTRRKGDVILYEGGIWKYDS